MTTTKIKRERVSTKIGLPSPVARYARTILIQAGRSLLMRSYKTNQTSGALSEFIERLKEKGKSFNVIAVAIANKLARIAYAYLVKNRNYQLV
ncbi:hypothetical protein [Candidatus Rickettsia kedanie]|uniref:hypothetical protein n=1 Tax=Candidatus Rickettsia kedanie TaxID=3115352 RepID=UPI00399CC61B